MGAGLMLRSFESLANMGLGFPTDNLLTFRLSLSGNRYVQPAARVQFVNEFIDRMTATPGVSGVTLLGPSMLSNATWTANIYPYENQPSSSSDFLMVFRHSLNPGGLETLGIAIQQGRDFTRFDTADAPLVAILSEGAARRLWPNSSAIGKQLRRADPSLPPITVVGVASDAVHRKRYSLEAAQAGFPMGGLGPQRDLYLPYPQRPNSDVTFAVRLAADPRQSTDAIRGILARIDRDLPLMDVEMLDDRLANQNGTPAAIAALLGGYGALALFLAALGVYGVMAQWVTERTRELGIRVALGANTQNILTLVLGKGFGLIVAGGILGMASSWWLTRGLEGLLYGISRGDSVTLLAVPAVLAAAGLVACWLPARRALSVNPVEVLRTE
jgi:putative ABC transport system permease protein